MCKFRVQVSRHSPQTGLPQLALWHHVGVTIGITLDKNGSLYDPAGTESCNVQIQKIRIAMLITEIKYQIATTVKWKYSCAVLGLAACHVSQNCNEKMQARPAGQAGYPISLVASLDTVPVKCCVPLHYLKREKREEKKKEILHLSRCYTHTHTYTRISPSAAFCYTAFCRYRMLEIGNGIGDSCGAIFGKLFELLSAINEERQFPSQKQVY